MAEKQTDFCMMEIFKSITGTTYNTNNNKDIFGLLIPDGWFIIDDNTLLIIEDKRSYDLLQEAKSQMLKYAKIANNKYRQIYCCIGFGKDKEFEYELYNYDNNNLVKMDNKLDNILKCYTRSKNTINPHVINEYMYKHNINLPKNQKTLFISFLLIVIKNDINFYAKNKNENDDILINNMFSIIDNIYNDNIFSNQFAFIRNSLYKKYIKHILKRLTIYISQEDNKSDIINKFYSEFQTYDNNNEGSLGIILTPDDIVNLMVEKLELNKHDYVLDTCTGTGSFLIKSSNITKHLIGCENNAERYTLAKCNFILHDIPTKYLYYDSCFNVDFKQCDKLIINPPFSCNSNDEESDTNITNWKMFKNERKFVLYSIQYIKEGGKGVIIIPRNNFNNSTKQYRLFKEELLKHITPLTIINCNSNIFQPNASVECSILIFRKQKCENTSIKIEQIDYSNDGYKIMKKIRTKIGEPKPINKRSIITINDDWNYTNNDNDMTAKELINNILTYNSKYISHLWDLYLLKYDYLNTYDPNLYPIDVNKYRENIEWKEFVLSELFDLVKITKDMKIDINKTNEGNIPLVSNTLTNNSIVKYIDKRIFTDGEYLTIGSLGVVAYNKTPFSITDRIYVIKSKPNNKYSLHLITLLLNNLYKRIYSFNNRINKDKILSTKINIPIYVSK